MAIRRGIFETNSSSTHSITVVSGDLDTPIVGDVIRLKVGEFGWEIESYYDFETKLAYLVTYICNHTEYDESKPNELMLRLEEVIKGQLGDKSFSWPPKSDDYFENGYIDHQSVDEAAGVLRKKDLIRDFLFNPNSELHTDNDNH